MTKSLPQSPSLTSLRYEAKQILKSHKAGDLSANETLRYHTRLAGMTDVQLAATKVSLQEAQHALALEYGLQDWTALMRAVERSSPSAEVLVTDTRVNLLAGSRESTETAVASPLLGIDIGCSGIKLLELGQDEAGLRVERYGIEPLPASAMVETEIRDPDAVASALQRLVARCEPNGVGVVVAIPGSSVITKAIHMPASLTDVELEREVGFAADQYIPYPLPEICLAYEVKGWSSADPDQLELIITASRKVDAELRCDVIEKAGLTVEAIDIEPSCIDRAYRSLSAAWGIKDDAIAAVFDIGASMTRFAVMTSPGRMPFYREQVFGAGLLVDETRRRYDMSLVKAESAVKNGGARLPQDYWESVYRPWFERLMVLAKRELKSFYSASSFDAVDQIVVCGGVASTVNFVEAVEEGLGVPTTLGNPLCQMAVSSDIDAAQLAGDAPALMLACGLALRGVTKKRSEAVAEGRNRTVGVPVDYQAENQRRLVAGVERFVSKMLADATAADADEIRFSHNESMLSVVFVSRVESIEVSRPPHQMWGKMVAELCLRFDVTEPGDVSKRLDVGDGAMVLYRMLATDEDHIVLYRVN